MHLSEHVSRVLTWRHPLSQLHARAFVFTKQNNKKSPNEPYTAFTHAKPGAFCRAVRPRAQHRLFSRNTLFHRSRDGHVSPCHALQKVRSASRPHTTITNSKTYNEHLILIALLNPALSPVAARAKRPCSSQHSTKLYIPPRISGTGFTHPLDVLLLLHGEQVCRQEGGNEANQETGGRHLKMFHFRQHATRRDRRERMRLKKRNATFCA